MEITLVCYILYTAPANPSGMLGARVLGLGERSHDTCGTGSRCIYYILGAHLILYTEGFQPEGIDIKINISHSMREGEYLRIVTSVIAFIVM